MKKTASLQQKFTNAMKKLEEMPPEKRRLTLAAMGALAVLPGVFSFKLVILSTLLGGATGMIGAEFDRKAGGGNKNFGAAAAGLLFMGLALAPFADVPKLEENMMPVDQITQRADVQTEQVRPAQQHATPQIVVR